MTVRYIGREYIDMAVRKLNVLSKITDSGLVAIIRVDNSSDAVRIFEACGEDPLIEEVARLLELLDPELVVVLLTARPAWVQPQTLAWLHRYRLRWDLLVMRDHGDYGAAREF